MSQENPPAKVEEAIDWWTYDRVVKDIPPPYRKKATLEEIYGNGDKPDIQKLKKIFFEEGRLEDEVVLKILDDTTKLFKKEPNMVVREAPITICGDVHGQYYDLLKLLEIGGDPATTGYIFLGLKKYNKTIYEKYLESFNTLPIAAYVNKQFLCIHGGLSPEITVLEDFEKINRFQEPPSFGPFCDILWADPIDKYGSERKDETFVHNPVRGCSYYFTYNACCKFLEKNKLLSVVRAHEAQDTGYRMYKKTTTTGFPSLITIFSAPNYLDVYNNGVMEILEAILKIASDEADGGELVTQELTRKDVVKNKIRAVGRMSRLFGILREESETVIMLKGLIPNGALPVGFLTGGKETITQARKKLDEGADHESIFEEIRKLDLINERRPPEAHADGEQNEEAKKKEPST